MPLVRWLRKKFLASAEARRAARPFALPVGMAVGIGAYFLWPVEPWWPAGPLACASAAGAALAARGRAGMLYASALAVFFVALGFSAASLRTQAMDGGLLASETPATGIEGRILELEPYADGVRVVLERVRIGAVAQPETPARVRIRLRGDQPALAAGTWIRLRGRLSPPSPPLMPGGFDFQRHAFFTGIGAVGFAMGRVTVLDGPAPGPFDWRVRLSNLRGQLAARVMAAVPGDAGAVAAALITGHRHLIPEAVLDTFRDAGLAHLLAISGLHIGLAAGIVFFAARRALSLYQPWALRLPVKKIAAFVALCAAFGYAMMAGATVPTQRAFLIAGLVLIAVITDRRGLSLRLLAWGAAVILLIQPESLLGPSFQMSFAAALALIAAYEWATERGLWHRDAEPGIVRRIALYGGGVAFTTVIASLATAPFVLYHFNQVATFGLLANLVAVPVTALWVMPAAMASFGLLPFGAEHLALVPMGWGTDLVIRVAERVAGLPNATQVLPSTPGWALAALAAGGVWFCVMRGPVRAAGLTGALLFVAAWTQVSPPDLIVSRDGGLAAIRQEDGGYLFSSLRRDRFARENWLAHAGFRDGDAAVWPRDGGYRDGDGTREGRAPRCDGGGCILRRRGWTLALVETRDALAEECGRADLVVSLVPAGRTCKERAGRLIDLFELRRRGAVSVTLGRELDIHAVNDGRGDRPWVRR